MQIFIDEAGRGPLAGPLYIGLVVNKKPKADLSLSFPLFRDSKKLSPTLRLQAHQQIQSLITKGEILGTTTFASNEEIDRYGITRAMSIAICRGIAKLLDFSSSPLSYPKIRNALTQRKNLTKENISLMIDGKTKFGLDEELKILVKTLVKGDDKIPEIAMASILAKVERDAQMILMAEHYPEYDFHIHKGYGTKAHYFALMKHGLCPQHRKLFLKKIVPEWKTIPFDLENDIF